MEKPITGKSVCRKWIFPVLAVLLLIAVEALRLLHLSIPPERLPLYRCIEIALFLSKMEETGLMQYWMGSEFQFVSSLHLQ